MQDALEGEVAALARVKVEAEKRIASMQQEVELAGEKLAGETKERQEQEKRRRAMEAQFADASIQLEV